MTGFFLSLSLFTFVLRKISRKEEGRGEPNDYLMYALHIVTAAFIIAMSLFGGPTIDIPTGA